jgi:hypothetical protein
MNVTDASSGGEHNAISGEKRKANVPVCITCQSPNRVWGWPQQPLRACSWLNRRTDIQIMERGKGRRTLLRLGPDFVLALTVLLGTFTLVCQGQQACVPFKVCPPQLHVIRSSLPACPSSLLPLSHLPRRARQPPDTDVTCSSTGATCSSLALYVPPNPLSYPPFALLRSCLLRGSLGGA